MRGNLNQSYRNSVVLLAPVILLFGMFFYELRPGYNLITIAYLIVLPFILLLSGSKKYAVFIGVLTTIFIIAGYLLSDFNGKTILTNNRILAGITVWMIICFSVWYRHTLKNERKAKKHLNAIFENATEGIIVTDIKGDIRMVNPHALELFGYNEMELKGRKIEQLIPDRFSKSHIKHRNNFSNFPHNRAMGEGLELFGKRKDGTEFMAEISLGHFRENNKLYVIAFITDITERKQNLQKINRLNEELEARVQDRTKKLSEAYKIMEDSNTELQKEIIAREIAEKNLVDSQRLYEAMARHFPNGIIGIMNKDMNYLLVDGTRLYEERLDKAIFLEGKVFDNLHTSEKIAVESELKKSFKGETITFEVLIKNNFYNVKAVPLPENNNSIDKILIVITNINTTKRNELTLIKNLEREKELGKLKSRFVSTASHEFRTPLSTILTSAYLLKNHKGKDYEKVKDLHILRINKSVNNLTEILNDFLSLSKLEEGKVETSYSLIDIESYLLDIKNEMSLQKQISQFLEYKHNGIRKIETDKKILRNIVLNVLSNAIKYSKEDGVIQFSSVVNSEKLIIKVQDQGIGIPEEDLPHIFQRFYRADNASYIQGTGLGLNIVKKYVALLDGEIHFKSKLNEGSTFTVELPIIPFSNGNPLSRN
ncbi:ATP-binding protein [Marivirga salinae]|uniref:histidine kinase n=1 Tax=Marivirga salinarum TaxID=3059078 RepID=A0AA49GCQ0_9BACT|nr:ATP-binding protein [Marivirga sp. BDSF4-3]WKK76989.2 ATP-binding protein [Marivirga sp. BDSF4-3]